MIMEMKKHPVIHTLLWLVIFAIAMGFFESAVVVYLREIYYPEGFAFPLKMIDQRIARVEVTREIFSMIMLVSVAVLSAATRAARLGGFLIAFAVWDITYYLFLKLFLDWPRSLFEWDILFLIPVTWTGPVVAPLLNSITMAALGAALFMYGFKRTNAMPDRWSWLTLIAGSAVTLMAYMEDYSLYMLNKYSAGEWISFKPREEVMDHAMQYIPESFDWVLFFTGEFLFIVAIIWYLRRMKKVHSNDFL